MSDAAPQQATPGQAAYEARQRSHWERRSHRHGDRPPAPWAGLTDGQRADEEAAVDAALMVAIPAVATRLAEATEENTRLMLTFDSHVREAGKIVGERDDLRHQRDQLAGRNAAVAAERNRIAESCATTAAGLSACRQNNAAIAAQSDRYRDERDELIGEILAGVREEDGDDIAPGALCVRYVRSLEGQRDALQRQLDARNRQVAELQTPEAAGIIADRASARAVVAEMTGRFGATGGSDWVACTTAGQLARWRKRAGLEADGA